MSDWIPKIREEILYISRYFFDETFLIIPHLDFIEDKNIPTLGVSLNRNRITLYYNPDFLNENANYIRGLLLHEILHVLLKHIYNRFDKNCDRKILNISCDLVINEIIFKIMGENSLPNIGITFEKIQNMLSEHNITIQRYQNAEYYYNKFMEVRSKIDDIMNIQLLDDHSGLYEDTDIDIDIDNLNKNKNEENDNENDDKNKNGNNNSNKDDENTDTNDSNNENEKEDENEIENKNQNGKSVNNRKLNNKKEIKDKNTNNGKNSDKDKNNSISKNNNSDSFDISDMLDRISGNLTNKILSLGINIVKNKLDFDFIEVIKKYIKKLSNEYKIRYTRLNKRSLINMSLNLDTEIKLKKIQKSNGNIIVALDTSGSMIEDVNKILNKIFSTFIKNIELPFTIKYIEIDDKIQYVEDFNILNKFLKFLSNKKSFAGSGGTIFNALFEYLIENDRKYELVLFFTDGVSENYDKIFNLLNKYKNLQFIFMTIGHNYEAYIGKLNHPRIKIFNIDKN